ncbi:MAG: hypothetical protein JO255_16860 [Alphaproteobacteria bacterium]|nr:hypothetical protein [Alphaproteobacteria bacterium]
MNGRRWFWGSTAALAVAVVLAAEPASIRPLPAADAAARPQLRVSSRPEPVSSGTPAEGRPGDVAAILARPIFSPSRRPEAAPVETPPAVAASPPPVAPLPRLTGVVTTPRDRLALFAAAEGHVMELAEGESIDGYVIRAISSDEVILTGPEGERALRPSLLKIVPHVIHALQETSAP